MLDTGLILDEKYEVIKVLGSGGMGTVYLCRNIRIDNLWAIKEVEKNEKFDFLAEPNILKKLKHPGIPRVIDIFYENDKLYMVEDYIEGITLKEYIKGMNFIGITKLLSVISEICDIIAYLHGMNPPIIYRDLKPSNIMITPEEKVVLIDFGISKTYKDGKCGDTVAMGSNGYAAPEQCGDGQSCIQTDIYGIGMVMYYMLKSKTAATALEPLMDENYGIGINKDLKRIIQKCVQIEIKDRYSSIEELKSEVNMLQENDGLEEKTLFMDNLNIKPKRKNKNSMLIRSVAGLFLMVFFISGGYLLYGKVKQKNDIVNMEIPASSNNVENRHVEKEEGPQENKIKPGEQEQDSIKGSNDSNNLNSGDNTSIIPKGKSKGRKKK